MSEDLIGRLLVAPLHEAVTQVLPARLDFYEYWLHTGGLRDGSIGLAPMTAVLGFLRAEGEAYHRVMAEAGRLAADWTIDGMSATRHTLTMKLPRSLRLRAALSSVGRIAQEGYRPCRTATRLRRGAMRFDIRNSLFCRVRGEQSAPLCTYHLAVLSRVAARCELPIEARLDSCCAMGGASCAIALSWSASA